MFKQNFKNHLYLEKDSYSHPNYAISKPFPFYRKVSPFIRSQKKIKSPISNDSTSIQNVSNSSQSNKKLNKSNEFLI